MTQVEFQQILEMINRSRSSLKEKLKGDQHKIDMNKNGKIDAEDFMHLRKKKPTMEESELDEGSKHAARPRSASRPGTEPAKKGSLQDRIMAARERIDAKKKDMKEEVEDVAEASKKIPASNKPVDPKDLYVSLKDVPVKKPRGHTQYDPAKEFPGVKAFKKQGVAEASKKIPASNKPVKPEDLYVSLKDVPVKKPRGHTQYDPAKEFPGVKAFKKQGVSEDVEDVAEETEHIDEISMDYLRKKDYLHKAEVSRKDAENTTRQYWKSPEEKKKARETADKRNRGIGAYSDRLYKTMKKPEYKSNNPMNSYPLGGRDEKSGRSYSE